MCLVITIDEAWSGIEEGNEKMVLEILGFTLPGKSMNSATLHSIPIHFYQVITYQAKLKEKDSYNLFTHLHLSIAFIFVTKLSECVIGN